MMKRMEIYCINLKSSEGRRARMERRFKSQNLKYNFIDALTFNSQIIDNYIGDAKPWYSDINLWKRDIACYASHLKAIKTFITESTADMALICEDDILLHKNFDDKLREAISLVPKDFNLIQLSYMISNVSAFNNSLSKNVYQITDAVWGAQLYLIKRKYAKIAVERYDRCITQLERPLTSEIIIRRSGGYLVTPPLAIEECLDSDRDPRVVSYHLRHFSAWNYDDYGQDEEKDAPIKNGNPWGLYCGVKN